MQEKAVMEIHSNASLENMKNNSTKVVGYAKELKVVTKLDCMQEPINEMGG